MASVDLDDLVGIVAVAQAEDLVEEVLERAGGPCLESGGRRRT